MYAKGLYFYNRKVICDFIPFRQLGQYEDEETGLYYNRFRYYDPKIGNYISQDPIRLGGNNPTLYGYVEDLNKWADIFGLDFKTVDFSGQLNLYQGSGKNTVKIKMQGSRGRDFTEAYKKAEISAEKKNKSIGNILGIMLLILIQKQGSALCNW